MRIRLLLLALLLLLPRHAAAAWPADPTTNVPLCLATGPQGEPHAIADGKGGAFVAWNDHRGANYDIYIQRVDATGTVRWTTNGVVVCNAANDQFDPGLAQDGAGGVIVAWSDYRAGTNSDIYAQRFDSLGAAKWAANGIVIANAANSQTQPRVLSDGSGGAFLTWSDERTGAGFGHIYVQHINSSGTALWTSTGVSTNNSPSGQNDPWIISNNAGGVLVAWEDYRSGDQDIYTQRVLSTGAVDPAWPIGGRQLCSLFQEQPIGGLIPDGSGGALVTWPQWNGGTRDIFVHHVLSTGALDPAWPGAGRRLANDFPDQYEPALASDGSGGALVSYFNYDFAGTRSARARHVLSSGTVDPAWPDTGLVLGLTTGDMFEGVLAPSDTAAIFVWMAGASGDLNIYAQRYFRTGIVDPAWPAGGRAICTAAHDQVYPTVALDGAGGIVVAWEDRRTEAGQYGDDGEIFAQGLRSNGTLGDPPVGVPGEASIALALAPPSPNPRRPGALVLRFSLPVEAPASLEVFDVAGRRVAGREVGTLGAGPHAVDLGGAWGDVPGVYFARLTQGRFTRVQRIVLLD